MRNFEIARNCAAFEIAQLLQIIKLMVEVKVRVRLKLKICKLHIHNLEIAQHISQIVQIDKSRATTNR